MKQRIAGICGIHLVGLWVCATVAHADIVVDGVNRGMEYTLTRKANSVSIDSGRLVIGNDGQIKKDFQVSGGQVSLTKDAGKVKGLVMRGGELVAQGGKLDAPVLYAGLLELNGDVKVVGGLSLLGGQSTVKKVDKLNGGIALGNDAVLFMRDLDVSGTVSVQDQAIVYFDNGFITDSDVNHAGKIIGSSQGAVSGKDGRLQFSFASDAALYVGVIPEPASLVLVLLAGGGLLFYRRMQASFP